MALIFSGFTDEYAPDWAGQLEALDKTGYRFLELRFADGVNVADLSPEAVANIKASLEKQGCGVSAIGSPLGKIKITDDFDAHLEKAKRVFATAQTLGAKFVRVFSFYLPESGDYRTEVLQRMDALVSLADRYGLVLCHENEAGIYGDSPARCLDLLQALEGRLGCVFDMGNFILGGHDPLEAYEMLEPYIRYFHVKDGTRAGAIVPPGKGEACVKEILDRYRKDHADDVFVSLEPHLQVFDGLSALTDEQFETPYVYGNPKEAFLDAATKLGELLT